MTIRSKQKTSLFGLRGSYQGNFQLREGPSSKPATNQFGEDVQLLFHPAIELAGFRILNHVHSSLPHEAVGLFWTDGEVSMLINQARSSTRFEVSTHQLEETILWQYRPNHRLLAGLYHSHPNGNTHLSPHDRSSMRESWEAGLTIPWVLVVGGGHPDDPTSLLVYVPERFPILPSESFTPVCVAQYDYIPASLPPPLLPAS